MQIGVSLSQDTVAALDAEAQRTGRSRSYVAAQRIEHYVDWRDVATLEDALRNMIIAVDRPCRLDRNGMCESHFRNSPCEVKVARAALAPFETGAEGADDGR